MEELVTQEEAFWLRQLLTNSHIGIVVSDMNRKIIFVNDHLCEKIGYTKAELLGQDTRIFHTSDESYSAFFKKVVELVQEGKPISIDYEVRHKDGHKMWISIAGNLLESKSEVLWSIVDISDRVEQERENKRLKERMEIALVGYSAGVWEWNLQTNQVYISLEWKQMLGYGAELKDDVESWQNRIHPDDKAAIFDYIQNAINNRETKLENTHRLKHKNGEWLWVLARATAFYEEDGMVRLVGIHTDITKQKRIEEELFLQKQRLDYLAHHDVLTKLPNRLMFNQHLEKSLERAIEKHLTLCVMFLDLDYFKEINDSFGHDIGDEVLKIVTKRFLEKIRQEDTLARLGGDEFALVVENLSTKEEIALVAAKLIDVFKDPIHLNESDFTLSCSIGISFFPNDGSDVKTLLKHADIAMYRAKEAGKNCYIFYK